MVDMKLCSFILLFLTAALTTSAQDVLTVEKIMRDPKWIGTSPRSIRWSGDSKTIYFLWNPEQAPGDSLYAATLQDPTPRKISKSARKNVPGSDFAVNDTRTKMAYQKDGDIFLQDLRTGVATQVTNTLAHERDPQFSGDEQKIFFVSEQNLFRWDIASGTLAQLTDFRRGKKPSEKPLSTQEKWLKQDQLALFDVLKERRDKQDLGDQIRESENPRRPKEFYLDDRNVSMLTISPTEKFITCRLSKNPNAKRTIVPNYVTESGFTEDINARTKVGVPAGVQELYLYDIEKDTIVEIGAAGLPGISDKITFGGEADNNKKSGENKKPESRPVTYYDVSWSPGGEYAAIAIRAYDNKDRWIALLNPKTRELKSIDRLHDDAWVSYSIGWTGNASPGWIGDNQLWFLSEESGYNHLYVLDVKSGNKRALTRGNFEVQQVDLPSTRKYFYIITNEVHPGEKQLYRLPVAGGKAERMTTMTGAHEIEVSPDEKSIAFRYSYSNKPWELYVMENKPGAKPRQITNSLTEEFKSYSWRDPELITFSARDEATLHARLYRPAKANGAAVVFVHGAGYLQNAHKWWSSYFREYMFHNLLADKGYTVLDIDYRASAGYGRDWRTGIYQFMGGKDLSDNIDGAKYLVDNLGIDPKRIGVYGGSYGGFITLMALFTEPDVFAAGAALRPVTDWAHYNQGYTSNILNVPSMDSLAYAKSSPIYYAEGLKNPLLICHGMVDVNVHFQDVVRLAQRLIELGKDNWELAVYPVEDHGFVEPSSWTDEYKRILKLFETNLMD